MKFIGFDSVICRKLYLFGYVLDPSLGLLSLEVLVNPILYFACPVVEEAGYLEKGLMSSGFSVKLKSHDPGKWGRNVKSECFWLVRREVFDVNLLD